MDWAAAWKRAAPFGEQNNIEFAIIVILFKRFTDIFPDGNLSVIDPQVKTAIGVGTNPGLVHYRGAVTAVVAQGNQHTLVTL
jgi:hypothetical protein